MSAIYFVYLLRCADGSLYCGVTTQPSRRVRQHNGELSGGGRYTRARRPVRLVACRTCSGRSEALSLEARLKRLPRDRKLNALFRERLNEPDRNGCSARPDTK